MVFKGINATGWEELVDGKLVQSSYKLYNDYLGGWFVGLLAITYLIMLYYKTKSAALTVTMAIIFASMFVGSVYVKSSLIRVIFLITAFLLAGLLYYVIWK